MSDAQKSIMVSSMRSAIRKQLWSSKYVLEEDDVLIAVAGSTAHGVTVELFKSHNEPDTGVYESGVTPSLCPKISMVLPMESILEEYEAITQRARKKEADADRIAEEDRC